MSKDNPIIAEWKEHPEMRAEFIRFLMEKYNSLLKGLADAKIKVGGTDPD